MKKIKQALRRMLSLTLVFTLVLDQNIVNAQVSSRQAKSAEQSAETQTDVTRETEIVDYDSQNEQSDAETDESDTELQTEAAFVNEITDGRSENSKQYLMSDKSVTVILYDEPVHFTDDDGNLVEIDNSLVKTDDGYTNRANTYDAVFYDNDEERGKVDFAEDGYEISWQLLETKNEASSDAAEDTDGEERRQTTYAFREYRAARTTAESETDDENASDTEILDTEVSDTDVSDTEKPIDDETTTDTEENAPKEEEDAQTVKAVAADSEVNDITDYEDEQEFGYAAKQSSILFDGFTNDISIEYIPQNDGIKKNIIMNNKTADYVHRFSISLKGLTASLTDENEIIFYDAETGEQKYYFPAPYMVDAEGNISYDVVYRIGEEEEIDSEESSFEENSSEEGSSEENSSDEGSSEAESASEEESSFEESSSEETSSEESSFEESSADEDSPEEESVKQDDSKEDETAVPSKEQDETEQTVKEETADEEENEAETQQSAVFHIDGPTLDGSAGSPTEESEVAEEEILKTEADEEEESSVDEIKEITDVDTGATVTISILPDSSWLETAQYPVTIDPMLKKSNGVKEITKVSINDANATRDTTTLLVGKKKNALHRSFVKFDLPALPKNSIITSAELTSTSGASDGTLYIEAHMVGSPWSPATITWQNQPQEKQI